MLNGWDTLTFAALAAGVRAVIWGAASILPEQCVALHRLLIDAIDLPAARDLWTRLHPLCEFPRGAQLLRRGEGRGARSPGTRTGPVRAPLLALDDGDAVELARLIEHARAPAGALAAG